MRRWARNLDGRSRLFRLIGAAMCLAAAVAVGVSGSAPFGPWRWTLVGALALLGGLQLFSAWTGWCVMRALGFRTPL